ncbi:protein phosphatase 2C 29-like [Gastrolobium bilobum]|uniref:protein phosphatase 2C 29-like n=1 Tax=Gastrolobium bilobum TaxID=150636 RepID=UPI002AB0CFC0|nr:protein phosphatase 2C 29-like [Gastrolobium bilobum]
MGSRSNGLCNFFSCFKAANRTPNEPQLIFDDSQPLDETLGHSFCYVRSSARFLSPTNSDRFLSPSNSLRSSPSHELLPRTRPDFPETAFKAISGASVSANSSAPKTVLRLDNNTHDDAASGGNIVNGFKSTSSFSALPLQPVPRGGGGGEAESLDSERRGFFLSGPIENAAGTLSGPLDDGASVDAAAGGVPFSAPLGGLYVKKERRNGVGRFRKAFQRNLSEKKRPWVVPVLNFIGRKEAPAREGTTEAKRERESNVQWALGKAGEDRVHVVVSEEQGWLFVGIYDGFNGPEAPEFLMGYLYRAVYSELQGLFWEVEEAQETNPAPAPAVLAVADETEPKNEGGVEREQDSNPLPGSAKRVTFQVEGTGSNRRRLWEFLAEDDAEDGLDLSGSDRFAFSVDDALSVSKEGSAGSRRWLLMSKLKHGLSKHKEGHGRKLLPWNLGTEDKEKAEVENPAEKSRGGDSGRKRKVGPVDHDLVLRALSRALEMTELAYLDMTDKVIDTNPELALMGSCLLVVLMRDEDVYVMNVGDSRAIVARYESREVNSSKESGSNGDIGSSKESIVEESLSLGESAIKLGNEGPAQETRLVALQLSTDHSTSIEEEVIRIKNEHPDDSQCIVNDRVKGRLKVTRAFGAGFLKQPKWNDVVLEMFRNEYIGTAPYISCCPSLRHHRLSTRDQFLILSSDGLYQYLSNQEVVSQVESFMEKFPDGDPAQSLIEELLLRAAKKAGMDLHELLDIPQGDRRKYHDDVTVMVISLEGRIWKSSGTYL